MADEKTSQNTPTGSIEEQEKDPLLSNYIRLFFDTVTDDSVNFQSQITDNYVENNTAIQDHIALAPIIVTLHGLRGELVYTWDQALNDEANALAYQEAVNTKKEAEIEKNKKLGAIEVYFPQFSNSTALAYNINTLIEAAKTKAKVVYDKLTNKNLSTNSAFTQYSGLSTNIKESRVRKCADYLKQAWQSRKAFVVDTPFGQYTNMYIQAIALHQGNENYRCELDVTMKQIRFADVATTAADQAVLSKYNQLAQAEQQNNGKAKGLKSEAAKLYDAKRGITS